MCYSFLFFFFSSFFVVVSSPLPLLSSVYISSPLGCIYPVSLLFALYIIDYIL